VSTTGVTGRKGPKRVACKMAIDTSPAPKRGKGGPQPRGLHAPHAPCHMIIRPNKAGPNGNEEMGKKS